MSHDEAVKAIEQIIRELRKQPMRPEDWDEDGRARDAIREAMKRADVNGLCGCRLCCS